MKRASKTELSQRTTTDPSMRREPATCRPLAEARWSAGFANSEPKLKLGPQQPALGARQHIQAGTEQRHAVHAGRVQHEFGVVALDIPGSTNADFVRTLIHDSQGSRVPGYSGPSRHQFQFFRNHKLPDLQIESVIRQAGNVSALEIREETPVVLRDHGQPAVLPVCIDRVQADVVGGCFRR